MDYEKKQPTADCIVARLVPSWGSRVSLLFKATEPYEHYYDENGDEVSYGAIASWTDVELPPESEDERIRKHIIDIIKDNAKSKCIPCDAEIAYLEKQKEPHYSPLCNTIKDKIREYIDNHFIADTVVKTDMKSIVKAMEEGVRLGMEEQNPEEPQQDKRKPAEWSKEDEDALGDAICAADMLGNDESFKKDYPSLAKAFMAAKDWLKSLPERFNLQPKQEWSEEDEKNFYWISTRIQQANMTPEYSAKVHEILSWLESLRPQPHWKPSEEQMKALENLIKCELSAGMHTRAGILQTLQNDLKKL